MTDENKMREFYSYKKYKLLLYFLNNNIGPTWLSILLILIQNIQQLAIYYLSTGIKSTEGSNLIKQLRNALGVFLLAGRSGLGLSSTTILFYLLSTIFVFTLILIHVVDKWFESQPADFGKKYLSITLIGNFIYVLVLLGILPFTWLSLENIFCGDKCSTGKLNRHNLL